MIKSVSEIEIGTQNSQEDGLRLGQRGSEIRVREDHTPSFYGNEQENRNPQFLSTAELELVANVEPRYFFKRFMEGKGISYKESMARRRQKRQQ